MKHVLITGATGFIGGRLAEVLVERGVEVTCLVRRWGGASRLARLPVRMVSGDVLDAASLKRAMGGCDVVMHGAVDSSVQGRAHKHASGEGTRQVMQAALELGVSRVVHLSSAAVHGLSPAAGTSTDEDRPLRRTGHDYCDGKIAAERIATAYYTQHGLPVSVLRPTLVYGPFGYYSSAVARAAREQRLVLRDGATGICNCVYVDNLIQSMLLAAVRESAVGAICTISDAQPVTWREFLERHAAAVDPTFVPLPVMSRAALREARGRLRGYALRTLLGGSVGHAIRQLRDPAVKHGLLAVPGVEWMANTAKATIAALPAGPQARVKRALAKAKAGGGTAPAVAGRGGVRRLLSPIEETSFTAFEHVRFSIDRARAVLGYDPTIAFDEGMARTAAWIQWSGI